MTHGFKGFCPGRIQSKVERHAGAQLLSSWQLRADRGNNAREEGTWDHTQYPRPHLHYPSRHTWGYALLMCQVVLNSAKLTQQDSGHSEDVREPGLPPFHVLPAVLDCPVITCPGQVCSSGRQGSSLNVRFWWVTGTVPLQVARLQKEGGVLSCGMSPHELGDTCC